MSGFFMFCPRATEDQETLRHLNRKLDIIMGVLDDLKAEVTAVRSEEDAAAVLLAGLAQQLKDAISSGDPVALKQVVDDLESGRASLAAAVTANTPAAAPAPAPAPEPAPADVPPADVPPAA